MYLRAHSLFESTLVLAISAMMIAMLMPGYQQQVLTLKKTLVCQLLWTDMMHDQPANTETTTLLQAMGLTREKSPYTVGNHHVRISLQKQAKTSSDCQMIILQ